MALPELTESRQDRLIALLIEHLRKVEIPVPLSGDGETSFTKRELIPVVDKFLSTLEFPGLVRRGSTVGQARSVSLLGHSFYPDLMVEWLRTPVLAVEVKLLRSGQRQSAIAAAVGQSQIYRRRYVSSAVMLVDSRCATTFDETYDATNWVQEALNDTALIFRQRSPTGEDFLLPHPTGSYSGNVP